MSPHTGTDADVLEVLSCGTITAEGRLVDASNATLYCSVEYQGITFPCVYKPQAGERPLWDFPDHTLAQREVAAYEVSAATGWELVPPTVLRDGPFGLGMCQLWVDVDEDFDLLALLREPDPILQRMALFDAVINNADRKGGHILPDQAGHLWGIDHGVTFSVDDKLRTLLWGWRGQPIPAEGLDLLDGLAAALDNELGGRLHSLLSTQEVVRTAERVARLRSTGTFPQPSGDWPARPWPPF